MYLDAARHALQKVPPGRPFRDGGAGDRTPDLVNAIHALSQLSYAPATKQANPPPSEPRIVYRGSFEVKKSTLAKSRARTNLHRLCCAGITCLTSANRTVGRRPVSRDSRDQLRRIDSPIPISINVLEDHTR